MFYLLSCSLELNPDICHGRARDFESDLGCGIFAGLTADHLADSIQSRGKLSRRELTAGLRRGVRARAQGDR